MLNLYVRQNVPWNRFQVLRQLILKKVSEVLSFSESLNEKKLEIKLKKSEIKFKIFVYLCFGFSNVAAWTSLRVFKRKMFGNQTWKRCRLWFLFSQFCFLFMFRWGSAKFACYQFEAKLPVLRRHCWASNTKNLNRWHHVYACMIKYFSNMWYVNTNH